MEGYVTKWTNVVTRWKKRYLVINKSSLEYFKDKGAEKKGGLEIKDCLVEMSQHDPCKFTVTNTKNGEAIYFRANNIQEKIQWLNAINTGKQGPQLTKEQSMRKMFAQILRERIFKERNVINDSMTKASNESAASIENLRAARELVENDKDKADILSLIDKVQLSLPKINSSLNDLVQEIEDIKADILVAVKKLVSIPKDSIEHNKDDKNDNSSDKESSFVEEIFYDAIEDHPDAPIEEIKSNGSISPPNNQPIEKQEESKAKEDTISHRNIKDNKETSQMNEDVVVERKSLAAKKSNLKVSFWTVLKDLIGKDLSHFALPVYFNEPLSFLQKVAECMDNEFLLEKAAMEKDPMKRLVYFSLFVSVQYSATQDRRLKPFNPVLGETYEYVCENFRFVSEQVCHHPPISACYVEGKNYIFYFHTNMKTKFWGRTLEFKPLGSTHLLIKSTGEHFSMTRPTSSVHNFIFGKIYVDQIGECISVNHNTGDKGVVNFIAKGWSDKSYSRLEGSFFNSAGTKLYTYKGRWLESVTLTDLTTLDEMPIWTKFPLPANTVDYYNYTSFAFQLNYLYDSLRKKLPPTDSRLRPDQRALENGDLKLAAVEKLRIEDKQRKSRKDRETSKIAYTPLFFQKAFENNEEAYRYNGLYWKLREKSDWSICPDIF